MKYKLRASVAVAALLALGVATTASAVEPTPTTSIRVHINDGFAVANDVRTCWVVEGTLSAQLDSATKVIGGDGQVQLKEVGTNLPCGSARFRVIAFADPGREGSYGKYDCVIEAADRSDLVRGPCFGDYQVTHHDGGLSSGEGNWIGGIIRADLKDSNGEAM